MRKYYSYLVLEIFNFRQCLLSCGELFTKLVTALKRIASLATISQSVCNLPTLTVSILAISKDSITKSTDNLLTATKLPKFFPKV